MIASAEVQLYVFVHSLRSRMDYPESYYRLTDQISAFEIAYSEDGAERFGLICRLPAGAELEVCGDGFNHRTLKVRCGEQCYFVFLQDLDSQQSQSITERCRKTSIP
jgi:hypothetical protein